jgi:hypothetical protein
VASIDCQTADLADVTNDQLLDYIAENWEVAPNLISELRQRLTAEEIFVLPVSVSDAIRQYFGGGRRTFDAMTKRIRFAYKVWQGKYGPWTPEQAEYAESLVLWAVNRAATAENPTHARPRVYTSLDLIMHHETTHAGFKAREGETVDIAAHLASLGVSA